jgi:hypothetical protein
MLECVSDKADSLSEDNHGQASIRQSSSFVVHGLPRSFSTPCLFVQAVNSTPSQGHFGHDGMFATIHHYLCMHHYLQSLAATPAPSSGGQYLSNSGPAYGGVGFHFSMAGSLRNWIIFLCFSQRKKRTSLLEVKRPTFPSYQPAH